MEPTPVSSATLVTLIVATTVLPWVLLFLFWRRLQSGQAAERLRRARIVVAIAGALGLVVTLATRHWVAAVFIGLFTIFALLVLSGRVRPRLLLRFAGGFALAVGLVVAIGTWGMTAGMLRPGAAWLGWVAVAFMATFTWLMVAAGAWCFWYASRPRVDLSPPAPRQA